MIDHVTVPVSDYARSKAFYEAALKPLGYSLAMEFEGTVGGFADPEGKPEVWIRQRDRTAPVHLALRSPDRATVDAFHQAAVAAGGRDNGAPGVRAHYHEHYYGAYVLDPDGNNIEATYHGPARRSARSVVIVPAG